MTVITDFRATASVVKTGLCLQAQTGLEHCSVTGKATTSVTHQSCPTGCTNQLLCKTARQKSVSQTATPKLMRGFFFPKVTEGGVDSIIH